MLLSPLLRVRVGRRRRLRRMLGARSGAVELTGGTSGHRRWYRRGPVGDVAHRRGAARHRARRAACRARRTGRASRLRCADHDGAPADPPRPRSDPARPPRSAHARPARSRSRIAATSGARTACRPRSSGATTRSSRAPRSSPSRRSPRLARLFVGLGVEKLRITGGEPTVRRDLPDLVRLLAAIDGVRDLTLTTNGSALRRLAGPLADGRPAPDHGQPGLARRRGLPADERGRLPGGPRPRRDRRRPRGGPRADQGEHGGPARRQRGVDPPRGPLGARRRADPALHRVHGRGPHERLADGRGRARRPRSWRGSTRRCPSRRCRRTTRARSPAASGTATARARSASSPRSRSRSAVPARARACRPRASSSPASSPPAEPTCKAPLRAGATDEELERADPRRLDDPRRPLLGAARRRHRRPAAGRDVRDRRLRAGRWRCVPRLPSPR